MATLDDSLSDSAWRQLQNGILQGAAIPNRYSPPKPLSTSPAILQKHTQVHDASRALHAATTINPTRRSAPNMGTLLMNSPQSRTPAVQRAETFHGLPAAFDGGDTQEVPSQVYRPYISIRQSHVNASDSQEASTIREDDRRDMGVDHTPVQPGTVNIMAEWDTQGSGLVITPAPEVHSLGDSHDPSHSPELLSSLTRETYPRTPGVFARRVNGNHDLLSPNTTSKTIDSEFSTLKKFKPGQAMMTHTQLFECTQADSSPYGGVMRSDPLDTRPSPDHVGRLDGTPSVRASPDAMQVKSALQSDGPQDRYRPLHESQELRSRAIHRDADSPIKISFDDEDETHINKALSSRLGHHSRYPKRRGPVSRLVRQSLQRSQSEVVGALVPPGDTAKRAKSVDLHHEVIEIDDDQGGSVTSEEESEAGMEGEPADLPEPETTTARSVDEHGRLNRQVESTQRSSASRFNNNVPESEDCDMEVAGSPVIDHPRRHADTITEIPETETGKADGRQTIENTADMVQSPSSRPPRLALPSSMSSYVPNTQFAPLSSQRKRQVRDNFEETEMSSIPRPPMTGPPDSTSVVDNVPSSPPVAGPLGTATPDVPEIALPSAHIGQDTEGTGEKGQTTTNETMRRQSNDVLGPLASRKGTPDKMTTFDTAPSHPAASQPVAHQIPALMRYESTESPTKTRSVTKFCELADIPQSQASLASQDIDDAMDVLAVDPDFVAAMASPRKTKKTTVYGKHSRLSRVFDKPTIARQSKSTCEPLPKVGPVTSANHKPTPAATVDQDDDSPPKKRRRLHLHPPNEVPRDTIPAAAAPGNALPSTPLRTAKETEQIPGTNRSPGDGDVEMEDPATPIAEHGAVTTGLAGSAKCAEDDESLANRHEVEDAPVQAASEPLATQQSENGAPTRGINSTRDRVLALFKGNPSGYYPATCLAVRGLGGSRRYQVRFDDKTETTLEPHHVCALDLRADDAVKVYEPGMRTNLYNVVRFESEANDNKTSSQTLPDDNGHRYVRVKTKRKDSLKAKAKDQTIVVPISSIYLTHSMWAKYERRTYVPKHAAIINGWQTPALASPPGTPSSRSRRHTINSGTTAGPVQLPTPSTTPRGVFTHCAFAVSMASPTDGGNLRDELVAKINHYGGSVVSSGLHELFDLVDTGDVSDASTTTSLTLKSTSKHLTFVALIADGHSRSQKYMQALSLGLPILHLKWVTDTCHAGKLLPWQKYLLPAGASSLLFGAVRSRMLMPFDPQKARLEDTIARRDKLLEEGGVLLYQPPNIKSKKHKAKSKDDTHAKDERRQVYAFLSLALGADRTMYVDSIEAVPTLLAGPEQRWKWVHCPADAMAKVVEQLGGGKDSADARDGVNPAPHQRNGGKKRKRSGLVPPEADPLTANGGDRLSVLLQNGVRVVSDEFVIQSLILGALAEE